MKCQFHRLAALEVIGRNILTAYDASLVYAKPREIPIEDIIENQFGLILEYHYLSKDGHLLGETAFNDGVTGIYNPEEHRYELIRVRAGTILIDESLCAPSKEGRLRYTCAHELAHWILHRRLYDGTGDMAAYGAEPDNDEGVKMERQADRLATFLLMPTAQVKRCVYHLYGKVRTNYELIAEVAGVFGVSRQAMGICLEEHNLLI